MVSFEKGFPVAVDGEKLPGDKLVEKLNTIAGPHGVGRVDLIENRLVGMKSRGCYETPGGAVIVEALRGLEELCLDRATRNYRDTMSLKFGQIVYDGQWFTPLREAMWASVQKIAEPVTGDVVVRLYKGTATTIQRRSPNSLYAEDFATFGADEVYNQHHAEGFIRLFSLPSRIAAMKKAGKAR